MRLGDYALMQGRGVNSAITRKIDDARGNSLPTTLIACENMEVGTGMLKRDIARIVCGSKTHKPFLKYLTGITDAPVLPLRREHNGLSATSCLTRTELVVILASTDFRT